eukprot:m.663170 g.663170  ORF g.663170 m.663170 type:complete len:276 (-) comp22742_c1_seq39:4251-5078(-)
MPYPQNLSTANAVEDIVRQHGACPATIAIINGEIHVGLETESMERLASNASEFGKASRRDLAPMVAMGKCAATTVSGTSLLASLLGNIPTFVTGGIGGVHRGVETTMDVSADLMDLARTPITVVCAGAKSILDIGKTLEVLETQGVPVVGYQTDEFPAFFTRSSGHGVSCTADSCEDIALMMLASRQLGLQSGMVVAVPIPEEHAAAGADIEQAIQCALRETEEQNIYGKHVTPYLLRRVNVCQRRRDRWVYRPIRVSTVKLWLRHRCMGSIPIA